MDSRRWLTASRQLICLCLLFSPTVLQASFIESTIGTAVVNDATATYFNPAALTLLKNPQIIGLGSAATLDTEFTGESTQSATNFQQSGSTATETKYFLPSLYLAVPSTHKITLGLAVISNYFHNNIDENSILRYNQSSNNTRDIDITPAIGIELNKFISLGAGLSFSSAHFLQEPTTGFPSLNIPDSQSRNESSGSGWGSDLGALFKLSSSTLLGFNYRSAVTYPLKGSSVFEGNPELISNNYNFTFWTPAREVLTLSQLLSPAVGLISTVQRIHWSIFDEINIHGIATQIGSQSVIVDADVPFHLHDTWLLTLGGQYRISPKWIIRTAGSYNQSPSNNNYQIATGNSIILGASTGYEIFKHIIMDVSYAHAFIQNEDIQITTAKNEIVGVNKASRDSVSLKLTFNL